MVDCSGYAPGTRIGPEILEGVCLDGVDFLLLYTGWAKKFGTDAQYGSYPSCQRRLPSSSVHIPRFAASAWN